MTLTGNHATALLNSLSLDEAMGRLCSMYGLRAVPKVAFDTLYLTLAVEVAKRARQQQEQLGRKLSPKELAELCCQILDRDWSGSGMYSSFRLLIEQTEEALKRDEEPTDAIVADDGAVRAVEALVDHEIKEGAGRPLEPQKLDDLCKRVADERGLTASELKGRVEAFLGRRAATELATARIETHPVS